MAFLYAVEKICSVFGRLQIVDEIIGYDIWISPPPIGATAIALLAEPPYACMAYKLLACPAFQQVFPYAVTSSFVGDAQAVSFFKMEEEQWECAGTTNEQEHPHTT